MKRLLYLAILFVLLGAEALAAPYETTVYNDVDAGGYGGFVRSSRRLFISSDNKIYVLYSEDANVAPEYQYSSNGGSTWSRQFGWAPPEANYKASGAISGWMHADTLYATYAGTSYGLRISKMFGTTRVIACDTVSAYRGASNTPTRSVVNFRLGDGSTNDSIITVTLDSVAHRYYAYVEAGRLVQNSVWSEAPTYTTGYNGSSFMFPINRGVGVFNVNVGDIFFLNGLIVDTLGQDIVPTPDGGLAYDWLNTSALARSPADSVLYIAFQSGRRLYFYRGYMNTVSGLWTRTDSVVVADTNGTPNANNGAMALRYPTLSKQGDKLLLWYKQWADSSDIDNSAIMLRTSTNEGASWSEAVEFRAATGADTIINLTSPAYLNDDEYDVVFVAWDNLTAAGHSIILRADTTQSGDVCVAPSNTLEQIVADTVNHGRLMVKSTYGTSVLDSIQYFYSADSSLINAARYGAYPDSGTTHTIIISNLADTTWYRVWAIAWSHEGASTCSDTDFVDCLTGKALAPEDNTPPDTSSWYIVPNHPLDSVGVRTVVLAQIGPNSSADYDSCVFVAQYAAAGIPASRGEGTEVFVSSGPPPEDQVIYLSGFPFPNAESTLIIIPFFADTAGNWATGRADTMIFPLSDTVGSVDLTLLLQQSAYHTQMLDSLMNLRARASGANMNYRERIAESVVFWQVDSLQNETYFNTFGGRGAYAGDSTQYVSGVDVLLNSILGYARRVARGLGYSADTSFTILYPPDGTSPKDSLAIYEVVGTDTTHVSTVIYKHDIEPGVLDQINFYNR